MALLFKGQVLQTLVWNPTAGREQVVSSQCLLPSQVHHIFGSTFSAHHLLVAARDKILTPQLVQHQLTPMLQPDCQQLTTGLHRTLQFLLSISTTSVWVLMTVAGNNTEVVSQLRATQMLPRSLPMLQTLLPLLHRTSTRACPTLARVQDLQPKALLVDSRIYFYKPKKEKIRKWIHPNSASRTISVYARKLSRVQLS